MQHPQQPLMQRRLNPSSEAFTQGEYLPASRRQPRRFRLLFGLIVALTGLTGFLTVLAFAMAGG
jgi:hypothetical protein